MKGSNKGQSRDTKVKTFHDKRAPVSTITAMSEFVFEKTFNFGGAALFLIAPWFIMVLSLIGYY